MNSVGFGAAFVAGLASFLSPCVLPLVPGYISYLSGMSLEDFSRGAARREVARDAGLGSLFFVLGFSLVFTALGASASAIGHLLAANMHWLTRAAGLLIVAFGVHTSGLFTIKWLYYERRYSTSGFGPGFVGAFLMGLAFAFGWTPCIGPILASILAVAATQQTVRQGMLLLVVYSLGLGVPFIVTGFGLNTFLAFFARYKRHIVWGERVTGVLLIAIGLLVFFGRLTMIIRYLPQSLFRFAL